MRLIFLDFVILCFQVILIFTSSSLTSALLQRASSTAAANNAESSSNRSRTDEETVENQEPPIGYEDEFVVEVNMRSSIRNVLYAEMDITQLREQRERSLLV